MLDSGLTPERMRAILSVLIDDLSTRSELVLLASDKMIVMLAIPIVTPSMVRPALSLLERSDS